MSAPTVRLARDLDTNPVACQSRLACGNPAVLVHEALLPDSAHEDGRDHRMVCVDPACGADVLDQLAQYDPREVDVRDATVTELGALSGLEITVPCPACWWTGGHVDTDMHATVCDTCNGTKVVPVDAVAPPAHSLIFISDRGTWQTASCTCSTGADHIAAVA
jgi:hypothetical protein